MIEPRAEDQYELREQGSDHVAGREAQVLLLRPRDEHRFAQRLWIDSRTGLMLRADVLGRGSRCWNRARSPRSRSASRREPQSVLQPMKHLEGYRQVRPVQGATQLES